MMEWNETGCAPDPRSLQARVWAWLGFGRVPARKPDDDEAAAEADGFAPGYFCIVGLARLGFRDRLRVLLSGNIEFEGNVQANVRPTILRTYGGFSIMPPNFRPGPEGWT